MKTDKQNDKIEALLSRIREGDQAAFNDLLADYLPLVQAEVARHAAGLTHEDTVDLRQVALMALYRAAMGFDLAQREVEFGLYAKICIGNALVSQLRVLRRHAAVLPLFESSQAPTIEDPAARVMDEEAAAVLLARIRGILSPYEYRVWTLYVAGCRSGEIARQLQKPPHSVENAVYRIRQKLRLALGDLQ